jgi:hypothetical protein
MVAAALARPIYELLMALGVLGAGLVIGQIGKTNPQLAERLSELLRVGPEADIDLQQIDYWKVQEAERFIRENPMAPSEGMSFSKPWAGGKDAGYSAYNFSPEAVAARAIRDERAAALRAERGKIPPGMPGSHASFENGLDNGFDATGEGVWRDAVARHPKGPCEYLRKHLSVVERDLRASWEDSDTRYAGPPDVAVEDWLGGLRGAIRVALRDHCGPPGSLVAAGLSGDPARRVFGGPCGCC